MCVSRTAHPRRHIPPSCSPQVTFVIFRAMESAAGRHCAKVGGRFVPRCCDSGRYAGRLRTPLVAAAPQRVPPGVMTSSSLPREESAFSSVIRDLLRLHIAVMMPPGNRATLWSSDGTSPASYVDHLVAQAISFCEGWAAPLGSPGPASGRRGGHRGNVQPDPGGGDVDVIMMDLMMRPPAIALAPLRSSVVAAATHSTGARRGRPATRWGTALGGYQAHPHVTQWQSKTLRSTSATVLRPVVVEPSPSAQAAAGARLHVAPPRLPAAAADAARYAVAKGGDELMASRRYFRPTMWFSNGRVEAPPQATAVVNFVHRQRDNMAAPCGVVSREVEQEGQSAWYHALRNMVATTPAGRDASAWRSGLISLLAAHYSHSAAVTTVAGQNTPSVADAAVGLRELLWEHRVSGRRSSPQLGHTLRFLTHINMWRLALAVWTGERSTWPNEAASEEAGSRVSAPAARVPLIAYPSGNRRLCAASFRSSRPGQHPVQQQRSERSFSPRQALLGSYADAAFTEAAAWLVEPLTVAGNWAAAAAALSVVASRRSGERSLQLRSPQAATFQSAMLTRNCLPEKLALDIVATASLAGLGRTTCATPSSLRDTGDRWRVCLALMHACFVSGAALGPTQWWDYAVQCGAAQSSTLSRDGKSAGRRSMSWALSVCEGLSSSGLSPTFLGHAAVRGSSHPTSCEAKTRIVNASTASLMLRALREGGSNRTPPDVASAFADELTFRLPMASVIDAITLIGGSDAAIQAAQGLEAAGRFVDAARLLQAALLASCRCRPLLENRGVGDTDCVAATDAEQHRVRAAHRAVLRSVVRGVTAGDVRVDRWASACRTYVMCAYPTADAGTSHRRPGLLAASPNAVAVDTLCIAEAILRRRGNHTDNDDAADVNIAARLLATSAVRRKLRRDPTASMAAAQGNVAETPPLSSAVDALFASMLRAVSGAERWLAGLRLLREAVGGGAEATLQHALRGAIGPETQAIAATLLARQKEAVQRTTRTVTSPIATGDGPAVPTRVSAAVVGSSWAQALSFLSRDGRRDPEGGLAVSRQPLTGIQAVAALEACLFQTGAPPDAWQRALSVIINQPRMRSSFRRLAVGVLSRAGIDVPGGPLG